MKAVKYIISLPGSIFSLTAVVFIKSYKLFISPLLPDACRYYPTCSTYAEQAIRRFGIFKGGLLAARRILSCNPFGGSGYDPVPEIFSFRK
ncbi:MAG TPA: membrane protein insertion efficiency factor YidD [Spirochaetota bacterium]|nr:membrane protein insertion efficiency factor YidD [Spirochaetota bacterium]HPJ41621.1 membrane protein insertion efficiency factor YidD [Spirochaetota bacterium]HRX47119.1 membrane protein insertion efficiency factor YidD [Spirochaetota bacterium]